MWNAAYTIKFDSALKVLAMQAVQLPELQFLVDRQSLPILQCLLP